MKKQSPSVELATSYQLIYDYYNEQLFRKLFGQPLPRPILNFSRRRNSAAFYAPKSWKNSDGKHVDEISLVPEWTGRDPKQVLSSLVHEMAHMLDDINGTAAKNGYHSRAWFKIMKSLGLPGKILTTMFSVSHDIEPGGAFELAYKAMPKNLVLPFTTSRPAQEGGGLVRKQTTQGRRARYECPQCALVAYAKFGALLVCGECQMDLHDTTPK